jgi:hypothetical protein
MSFINEQSKIEGFKFIVEYREGIADIEKTYRLWNINGQDIMPILREIRKDFRTAFKSGSEITVSVDALEYDTLNLLGFKRFLVRNSYNGKLEYNDMTAGVSKYEKTTIEYPYDDIKMVLDKMIKTIKESVFDIQMVKPS